MTFRKWAVALVLGASISAHASAAYPDHAITLVVPFETGGSTDIVGRIVADQLAKALKTTVIVENRGGGGGSVGASHVSRSAADGYTLLLATAGTHSIGPNLRTLPYDPVKGFTPISLAAKTAVVVTANTSLGVKTLKDLVALAKSKPDSLNFASAGTGSLSHLTGELFDQLTGAKMVHVPYKGIGPALADLLADRVQVCMNNLPSLLPQIQAGKLVALAVASDKRSPLLPDVPTSAQAGVPGLVVDGWFGVVAPAGVPADRVDRLFKAMQTIDKSKSVEKQLNKAGSEPEVSKSPQEFKQYIVDQLARWKTIVDQAGARTGQ